MKKLKQLTKAQIKKQERILKRKLLAKWAFEVKERDKWTCAICGIKRGELTKNGKEVVFNAHHLLLQKGEYSHLKHEVMNGITVCQSCHLFSSSNSPHKQSLVFAIWLQMHRPNQYAWVLSKIGEIL